MSNPYFNNDPFFGDGKGQQRRGGQPGAYPGAAGQQGYPGVPQAGQSAAGATGTMAPAYDLEQAYNMPAAGPAQTGRMTYDDVIIRTGSLLGIIVVTGALAWFGPQALGAPQLVWPLMLVGAIGGLVLGLVNSFKREPSPALIVGYAALEGLFLGGISGIFETMYPGIVVQAVLATFATFGATLLLFRSGKIRVTPKFQRIVLVALVGYAFFSLINLGLMLFGVMDGWGMREGPIGILIGVAAVILAAACLVIDFDAIKRGIERGAPAKYAWAAAFGLTVTLVWMYLEFLRLLAILRGD
ncbi:protein of unknown function DUF1112 [Beutenbergia cavernae DSM 12333]|uniref:Integral membrane protein n=1 Tax=Beutenbergia cavernae (strain ATCC BAA-8 / DSM 12333 / CCUG 43141 / JCM 11478 / NBRC 16432 / NCIMB 13614 / HKI 0122) TaxID=471853 RepID=C5C0C8_BEUC1|nr:Bax inhibitor-1/YccA family protein [Beutenbergia cavernae]ACQ79314.1 protein of unknown function DUF1112 [Beutenbergia cavernae DSM 12333]